MSPEMAAPSLGELPDARKHRYSVVDEAAVRQFVELGYVVIRDIHDPEIIQATHDWIMNCYDKLEAAQGRGDIETDINGWAVSIIQAFERTDLYEDFIRTPRMIHFMNSILGPDLCLLGYDALWINAPKDDDPVLLKGQHTDAWTGSWINTVFAKTFLTDVDVYNGMCVSPGSHALGLVPVRNRAIDPAAGLDLENLNLDNVRQGDVLIWHPLLIHATTGHSDKNIRISITSRFKSTESPFSTQERALGYRTLSVGPMNQVLRLIGNDLLSPFRTLGGHVGIDRRMSDIYPHGNYEKLKDYSNWLK